MDPCKARSTVATCSVIKAAVAARLQSDHVFSLYYISWNTALRVAVLCVSLKRIPVGVMDSVTNYILHLCLYAL